MTDAPRRIQRKRTKGWRMPPNTVYVGRPSKWGNHNVIDMAGTKPWDVVVRAREEGITPQQYAANAYKMSIRGFDLEIQYDLRGKNLSCWCPLDQPCHADVLLEIANAETRKP